MKPIIKWSGGKSQEIKFFKKYYPDNINHFVEPFTGGAAVFFDLEHSPSILNDINFELISFYSIIGDNLKRKKFIEFLEEISSIRDYYNSFFSQFSDIDIIELFEEINLEIKLKDHPKIKLKYPLKVSNDLKSIAISSLMDKIKRVKSIEVKENKWFSIDEKRIHLITALQSSLYFNSRKIYNSGERKNLEFYIANWYYVREFCYSSMFRFSKNGNFNVPYGGIGYNTKNFKAKIDYLKTDKKLHSLLKNTEVNLLDFEDLFKKHNYFKEDDFIFLDPPYDSEFSQYNAEKDFDKKEQIRLRDEVLKIKGNIMIVIKETDFIYDLYKDDFFILKFDKKYLTNMRNRNDKDVIHLIITNYPIK